ncbi:hypothetical protein K493DRAFT_359972 [Basidiobolus meristosporus CBS 931.73]|uniref:NAD(P)-binding protein n=1 Tax=Basidiobolus meristosporus CBS 931.73 TaxID=1314790 RepID=A0A1Y1XMX5_9FUNG|nr:hypothetical protein K493DRAFT_359972 [Basidiobolus meristosporus CBS 931.73]|eukprot:ORX87082.1 hypothetical protein K493DRAFT_359972 [Basidiobolus meristosporus CBS 931.73]
MKVILTGATGFVGGETPLEGRHDKLSLIMVEDFARPSAHLARLGDHEACVWCIGGKASDFPTEEEYLRVSFEYTLAAATATATALSNVNPHLRFCYLSGLGADPTESRALWLEKITRYVKGRTEAHLTQLCADRGLLRVHLFRPGGILANSRWNRALAYLLHLLPSITILVDQLAQVMIEVALHGGDECLWEHGDILAKAKELSPD